MSGETRLCGRRTLRADHGGDVAAADLAALRPVEEDGWPMSFLELSGVQKHYGPVAALAGVDLSVTSGSRTAIVGPSGCGKTTLARLIAGFEAPDAGPHRARRRGAGQWRRRRSGASPRHRRGGAGRRPVPASDHRRQYRLRHGARRRQAHRAHRRARLYRRAGQGDPEAPPARALRRPAAACGAGPRHGDASRG